LEGRVENAEPNASRIYARPSIVLGAACLLLHLIINNRYDVFRDELYFIVCGQHPALGYVDQPPLIPLIAGASHALFGVALLPLRLVPALAMSATVALAAEFARLLGGGRFAQWLGGLCVLVSPVLLVDGLLLSTDALQPLTWLACGWCLVRLAQTGDERWWWGFGLAVGISLASKYLIFFYLAGLAVGILMTPLRASLLRPQLYIGAAIALIFLAPSLYWQAENGWPFLEIGKAGASGKNVVFSPLGFLGQQLLFIGPATAPIWLAGLWRFTFRPALPQLRVFPIAYAATAVLVYAAHGKAYYISPIYPALLASGAVAIEDWVHRPRYRWIIARVIVIAGAVAAPLALPILPPDSYHPYAAALGISPGATAMEKSAQGVLPQQLADMFGWREMAAKVSAAYNALTPEERAKAVFFGHNYGEAAAIDVYGPALHGPPAISGHNNYYLWGLRGFDGSIVLTVGGDPALYARGYQSVEQVGELDNPYAMPYETNIPVYLLRNPRVPLVNMWPEMKHYE
jgi:4-amino-4-deoxy-L-arabinose transferase-like glycosyltransferase